MTGIALNLPVAEPAGPFEDVFYRSHDDLMLYARCYGPEDLPARTALCLPGLTRNSKDFHDLALALSTHPTNPRRVYALDYRGRGRSEWDKTWRNYSPLIELIDVINLLTIKGLHDLAIIGTSRGGIIGLLLAVMRPSAVGCVVLNDIGPVIETAGLARILGYVGKVPVPINWEEAVRLVRDMNKRQFPALTDETWEALARQWFNEVEGRPAAASDPNISRALGEIDISKPIPEMWHYFDAVAGKPVMVLRGENSDILSARTVQEMAARHPSLTAYTIQNEGHAPLLRDPFSQRLVVDFLNKNDPLPRRKARPQPQPAS
jgi:pimeloyl-ACP methyl ester carboxylesterase